MIRSNSQIKQQGVTLIFSLMILITLTLIGITSMQSTRTELAMAGNQREASLMFHAAEMGLVAAENHIQLPKIKTDITKAIKGMHTVKAHDTHYKTPDYYDDTVWTTKSQEAENTTHGLHLGAPPRYQIEYMGDRHQNALALLNIGSYGNKQAGTSVSIYRATSRGVGLTGNAYRYVQSYFGKEID